MLSRVDIISINCPHTPETHHMINAERLRLMQRHAYLINTARGEIIDEPALIAALQERRIAGAGLDVFEHEPAVDRSEEHTSELQSLMRISYAVFCLKKK